MKDSTSKKGRGKELWRRWKPKSWSKSSKDDEKTKTTGSSPRANSETMKIHELAPDAAQKNVLSEVSPADESSCTSVTVPFDIEFKGSPSALNDDLTLESGDFFPSVVEPPAAAEEPTFQKVNSVSEESTVMIKVFRPPFMKRLEEEELAREEGILPPSPGLTRVNTTLVHQPSWFSCW